MTLSQKICLFCLICTSIGCGTDQILAPSNGDTSNADVAGDAKLDAVLTADVFTDVLVSTQSDVMITPGQFGYACEHSDDCDSGLCLQTENGKKCSMICVQSCQSGYACGQVVGGGTDVQFVCVSRLLNLCNPCTTNDQCNFAKDSNNACISHGDAGSFCGVTCDPVSDDCPKGYTCKFVTDPKSGAGSSQCLPSGNATCACSPFAIQKGFSTACANTNPFGSCAGTRTCTVNGLSGCVGQVPEQEICNGKDDNCDAKTDNIDENTFGVQCDKKNEFGTCLGKFIACSDGKAICNAPDASPETCNGKDDDCDGKTDEDLCDDGNSCTTDVCNTDGGCKHTPLTSSACDDANICTALSQCAAGTCIGGSTLNCNDNDPCTTDSCDPFTGCKHAASSDGKCTDDGNACTQDKCADGKCMHPQEPDGTKCLDDGNVCTTDVCASMLCTHVPNALKCDDGLLCTINDKCKDSMCSVHDAYVCSDGNGCTSDACDEAKKGCVFLPYANPQEGVCNDDGQGCTVDACIGNTCTHKWTPGCK